MADKLCPLLQKPCIEHQCKFFSHIQGEHPQSGAALDLWDCSIAWLPVLLVKNAQEIRQTAAAVESFRNQTATIQGLSGNDVLRRLEEKDS